MQLPCCSDACPSEHFDGSQGRDAVAVNVRAAGRAVDRCHHGMKSSVATTSIRMQSDDGPPWAPPAPKRAWQPWADPMFRWVERLLIPRYRSITLHSQQRCGGPSPRIGPRCGPRQGPGGSTLFRRSYRLDKYTSIPLKWVSRYAACALRCSHFVISRTAARSWGRRRGAEQLDGGDGWRTSR